MSTLRICCCFLILGTILFGFGVSIDESICRQTLDDKYVKRITWDYLRDCLTILSGQQMSKETAENIWRLLKLVSASISMDFLNPYCVLSAPRIQRPLKMSVISRRELTSTWALR